jgi:hypothetical protein
MLHRLKLIETGEARASFFILVIRLNKKSTRILSGK